VATTTIVQNHHCVQIEVGGGVTVVVEIGDAEVLVLTEVGVVGEVEVVRVVVVSVDAEIRRIESAVILMWF